MIKLTFIFFLLVTSLAQKASADHMFEELVQDEKYQRALNYTCLRFKVLDCKKVKIVDEINGAYATAANYTNTIHLSKKAFLYHGEPSMGWLAAIIGHENQHQNQSMYVRQVAGVQIRFLKNYYWEAILELPSWAWMNIHADTFNLSPAQRYEIQDNINYFTSIIESGGKLPD